MELTKELLYDEIGKINDSDLGVTLTDLNAISSILINDTAVQISVNLIQPIQWIYADIKSEIKRKLDELAPDHIHEIFINEADTPNTGRQSLSGVKNIIAVASGKGGVGKSSIASNLAAGLSLSGAKVGIIDGDVYGPSQPTMYGVTEERLQVTTLPDGTQAALPIEQFGVKIASMGFVINRDEAAIVRGPMLAGYFSMLFEQVAWGDLDFLVFDLPPGTGDIQLTLTQKIPLTGAVIVTTPQEISLADVRRSITMFNRVKVDVIGIVENMSYFTPDDMPDKKYFIFGEGGGKKIAEEFDVNLLGQVPLNISMREGNDGGMPVILSKEGGKQKEVLKNITANVVKGVRQLNYAKSKISMPTIEL
ncbi:MAG: Mrp/NBP35 family ATP-binding protein [Candidatus Kapabacteria bacterium]|nr:Mrp/NBP35 family ATP-binding protein [Ignavibacteriota bacterium]MCW5883868.1 Mrp/NBP35 family ATP-binding protein [Candidatus Kapabacteria bacterium]